MCERVWWLSLLAQLSLVIFRPGEAEVSKVRSALRAGTTPDRDLTSTITTWSCTGVHTHINGQSYAYAHKYACVQPITQSGSLVVNTAVLMPLVQNRPRAMSPGPEGMRPDCHKAAKIN